MSCCWRPVAHQQLIASGSRRAPAPEGNGIIPLSSYLNTSGAHTGELRNQTLYLVGWKTEHERLFLGTDAKKAIVYRNETDKTLALDTVTGGQITSTAIDELLARA